jgi:ParB/RepB/Spo0J family partition protein
MTIHEFPVRLITRNPFQPRIEDDPQKEAELLESIKVSGIIQVPDGRLDPKDPNFAQLRCGHRRLAAWRKAFPGKPFRIDIKELTDREMSDGAIRENNDRHDLSAIEKMRAIQRRMKDFGLNELQAGEPFHLKTPSSVSNLLRLGHLPEKTQMLVHRGQLPERYARGLVLFSRMDPKAVDVGAASIAGTENESVRDGAYRNFMRVFLYSHGTSFNYMNAWPMSWPPKPIPAGHRLWTPTGVQSMLPACKGCPYLFDRDGFAKTCLRPDCFSEKTRIWKIKQAKKTEREKKKNPPAPVVKPRKQKPDPKIQYSAEASFLITAASYPLAPAIPAILIDILHGPIIGGYISPEWRRADRAERRRMLMIELLEDAIPHSQYDAGKPEKTAQGIKKIARGLRIRLPKAWDSTEPQKGGKKKRK